MKAVPSLDGNTATLVELGLTVSEAKVYLTLVQIGPSRIGVISETAGIHRANLYPTLQSLEHKCLIEKEVDLPAVYRASSPDIIMPMLVKRKQTQVFELKTKAEAIAASLRSKPCKICAAKEKAFFSLIPGKEVITHRLRKMLQETKFSLEAVTTKNGFAATILEFGEDYKEALDRGVKIQIATESNFPKSAFKMVQVLAENSFFEVKCLSLPVDAGVFVFDGKQATVLMSCEANLDGISALWSNNECFVAIVKNYFENKWNNA
jgi:sugar-specific transcriptional regulator TrmB